MRKKTSKCKIYIRNFIGFLIVYLFMMIGFSIFLISHENTVQEMELYNFGLKVNDTVGDILGDNIDSNHQIKDMGKVNKELVKESNFFTMTGAEIAVYTDDYNLIYNTNDYWFCGYDDNKKVSEYNTVYGYINPKEWFSEQEIMEIESYLYADPKAEKEGDLSGYFIQLDRFWVDKEMIIPDKITITANYAINFDKDGRVILSSGDDIIATIYVDNNQNTKELPHYEHGYLMPSNEKIGNSTAVRTELRQMILDQEMLNNSIGVCETFSERVSMLTYRYYVARPYQNSFTLIENKNYSEFWTVIANQVNLWDECSGTLFLVWGACFLIVFAVAIILSRQTVKTYQKRDQLELQRQEMTNALAHDLKTPLSIISGYAQNLMENIHTEKREYYAGNIQDNVTRMDKIIKEMLEVSRLEAGLSPSKKEEISLNLMSLEIMNRYKQVCEEKSIDTHLEGDAVVWGDESFIIRVIDNFYINALEHTSEGGSIRITIDGSVFELYNSGSHIPDNMFSEIWLPYKKVEKSRSNTKGTGLGLSIARTILDYYDYSYGVRNTEDGVVFWFQFKR